MLFPQPQTPNDIIAMALRTAGILGIGQEAANEDLQDGFQHLNMMLAEWNTKRAHVFGMDMYTIQATGNQTFSVGPGGEFNITRPDKIETAFIRQNAETASPVDFPLTMMQSMEDYARIGLKSLSSFPSSFYYDPEYPMGVLYVWPVALPIYEITIVVRRMLEGFATPAEAIVLPPQYLSAIVWNLAYRLCLAYRVDPTIVQPQAKLSLAAISNVNAQIPALVMPDAVRNRNAVFNIYGDQYSQRGD